jgi:hypothetical protein
MRNTTESGESEIKKGKERNQSLFADFSFSFSKSGPGVAPRGPPVEVGRLQSESLLNLGPQFQDWVPSLLGLIAMR